MEIQKIEKLNLGNIVLVSGLTGSGKTVGAKYILSCARANDPSIKVFCADGKNGREWEGESKSPIVTPDDSKSSIFAMIGVAAFAALSSRTFIVIDEFLTFTSNMTEIERDAFAAALINSNCAVILINQEVRAKDIPGGLRGLISAELRFCSFLGAQNTRNLRTGQCVIVRKGQEDLLITIPSPVTHPELVMGRSAPSASTRKEEDSRECKGCRR